MTGYQVLSCHSEEDNVPSVGDTDTLFSVYYAHGEKPANWCQCVQLNKRPLTTQTLDPSSSLDSAVSERVRESCLGEWCLTLPVLPLLRIYGECPLRKERFPSLTLGHLHCFRGFRRRRWAAHSPQSRRTLLSYEQGVAVKTSPLTGTALLGVLRQSNR